MAASLSIGASGPLSCHRSWRRLSLLVTENDYDAPLPRGLAEKYGKKLQAISGIHYNMELGKDPVTFCRSESAPINHLGFLKTASYLAGSKLSAFPLDLNLSLRCCTFGGNWLLQSGNFPAYPLFFSNSDYGYVNDLENIQVSYLLWAICNRYWKQFSQASSALKKKFYSSRSFQWTKSTIVPIWAGITYLKFRCFRSILFDHLGV